MAERKRIEMAKVIIGKGKNQLTYESKALGQKSLTEATDYYKAVYNRKQGRFHFNGKLAIGKVLHTVAEEVKNTTEKGRIFDHLFPALTPNERSKMKKMYQLSTDHPEFIQWKSKHFPNLNSEAAILDHWNKLLKAIEAIKNAPEPTPESEESENRHESDDGSAVETTNRVEGQITVAELKQQMRFVLNQGITLANTDKLEIKDVKEINEMLQDFFHKVVAPYNLMAALDNQKAA